MCACFCRGQAGWWGLLSLQMRRNQRWVRKNETRNFVRVGRSSSKYLFYLRLGAPLLPASIQEYNDPQSQWVGSLGSLYLRGEITKLFTTDTGKTDTDQNYLHTHLQLHTISNSMSDIPKKLVASIIYIKLYWCLRTYHASETSSISWDNGVKFHKRYIWQLVLQRIPNLGFTPAHYWELLFNHKISGSEQGTNCLCSFFFWDARPCEPPQLLARYPPNC